MEARARGGPRGVRGDEMMEEGLLWRSSGHEDDLGGARVACATTGRWCAAAMVVEARCGGAVWQGAGHGVLPRAWMWPMAAARESPRGGLAVELTAGLRWCGCWVALATAHTEEDVAWCVFC